MDRPANRKSKAFQRDDFKSRTGVSKSRGTATEIPRAALQRNKQNEEKADSSSCCCETDHLYLSEIIEPGVRQQVSAPRFLALRL